MPRRPGDTEPEPPGGRAAERLREFIDQRFPGGVPVPEGTREDAADEDCGAEQAEQQEDAEQGGERADRGGRRPE
jgi:hypothetical protein